MNRVLAHILQGRGKMLRPALVLLSGRAVGELTDLHIELAAIIEMIHTASLLHDDVIDEAATRRGKPTTNVLHGNEAAVLMGDFLLSRVFGVGIRCKDLEILRVLSEAACRLCQGELLQNIHRDSGCVSREIYFEIVRGKTAALFSAACRLGALAAGGQEAVVEAMAEYGLHLGIAFQITDDLLDLLGSENVAGKTLGADLAQHKVTLPMIHLFEGLSPEEADSVRSELFDAEQRNRLLMRLKQNGSIAYAQEQARTCCDLAVDALRCLPSDALGQPLRHIASALVMRHR